MGHCRPALSMVLVLSIFVLTLTPESSLAAPPVKENANDLVDAVVKLIKPKFKPPMKPIKMHDRTIGVNERIGLIRVTVVARIMQPSYINHIGGMARIGDAFMTEFEDESTLIEMRVGVFDIKFNSTVEIEVMGIRQKESVLGTVAFFGVSFEVMTNATTGGRKIDKIRVFEISGLELNLLGPEEDMMRRIQNLQLRMGLEFVMNSNFKRLVHSIVGIAAGDSIARIAGAG